MSIYDKLGPGDKAPEVINVVIEIRMNSYVKYEIDKKTGLIKVDRILYTSMHYPFNYGFVPGTLEEDGDPIDVIVISYEPLLPGSVIEVKPIGVLEMEDEEGPDAKIIAVPKDKIDPRLKEINSINDLPEAIKSKIKHFFEHYKELEPGKWVKVTGWKDKEEALTRIRKAIERYSEKLKEKESAK